MANSRQRFTLAPVGEETEVGLEGYTVHRGENNQEKKSYIPPCTQYVAHDQKQQILQVTRCNPVEEVYRKKRSNKGKRIKLQIISKLL